MLTTDTLKKQVYHRILEGIIKKDYPMDYILKEKELAGQFEISRAPVREALIELCQENIVQSIPRAGYRIVRFTEKDIHEATELRIMLELPILDRIVSGVHEDTLRRLFSLVEESQYTKHGLRVNLETWWHNNIRFHLAVNAAGGNSLLTDTLDRVLRRQWRIVAQLFWNNAPEDYQNFESDTHEALLNAIKTGDRKRAKKILSDDILSIRKICTY
ncbi:MAG: GntR family transcriptional regulator [Treponema sp.]|jgi:DNA-binding GntR family transcriptional regulator|nr:GntR family transcriptional regulator [Treponema sp.]